MMTLRETERAVEEVARREARLFDEWLKELIRPYVPPFLIECVEQRRALHLAARYLELKGFYIKDYPHGLRALYRREEELGRWTVTSRCVSRCV